MKSSLISAAWPDKDAESLLWLASYPRSGNTFTRILLANYFKSGAEAYDINKLHEFIPADTSSYLWEDFTEGRPGSLALEWTWSARPHFIDYYRKLPKPQKLAGMKTHTANVTSLGSRGFTLRKSDRVIYIVRHPLDVLLSYADFNGKDADSAIEILCTSGISIHQKYVGGLEVRGSWTEHVSSWLNTADCPVLLVRYEELRTNTADALKSILAFLGAPIIAERIDQAVEASHFDRVRAQEAVHSFNEAPETLKSGRFFRKGQSLQWLRELTPDQAYRLADACDPIMSKLGYAHPRDVYFDGRNAVQPINLRA